jgi:hypothetical protein
LLLNCLQDRSFLDPVTQYGIDLVEHAFKSKEVEASSADMIYEVLVKE